MANFFSNFMGDTQIDDLREANTSANRYLDRGLTSYTDISKEYTDRASDQFGALDVYSNAGTDSLSLLRNIIGLNGPDAQRSFFANIMQDPGYLAGRDAGVDAADASAAARGMLRSGGQQRDLYSFGNRYINDFVNNKVSQLGGLLNTGAGIATNVAGNRSSLFSGLGSNLANAELGINQLKAGQSVGLGNAVAQQRGTGMNNLLAVGNMVGNIARGFSGMPSMGGGGGGFFGNGGFQTIGFDRAGNPNYGRV